MLRIHFGLYLTDPGAGTAPGSFEGVVLVDRCRRNRRHILHLLGNNLGFGKLSGSDNYHPRLVLVVFHQKRVYRSETSEASEATG